MMNIFFILKKLNFKIMWFKTFIYSIIVIAGLYFMYFGLTTNEITTENSIGATVFGFIDMLIGVFNLTSNE